MLCVFRKPLGRFAGMCLIVLTVLGLCAATNLLPADTAEAKTLTSATTQSVKSSKSKAGNCDWFIGQPKHVWVIAIGKHSVAIHKKASSKSRKIASFQGKSCIVVDTSKMTKGKNYKWLRVKLKGKRRGYIKKSSVRITTINLKTFGLNISKKKNRVRARICRYGVKHLGVRYTHGYSIKHGLQCSSFVKKCYNAAGFKMKSIGMGYLASQGKGISRKKLKPGDMVFYPYKDTSLGHVAVYIGKGLIVNSSGFFGTVYPRGGIRISTLNYRTPHANRFRNVVGN